MIITDNAGICQFCHKNQAIIICDGCSAALCKDCRKFDLWGYGCGHVDTKVFCPACFDNITVNPYSGQAD
ncbi:MAG TPA: B-box zinc finger protein [Smithellaceae bacterium]|nr:B-box zinc finger protein [Smithellaceae bacterium]